jgi:hypothetical protein
LPSQVCEVMTAPVVEASRPTMMLVQLSGSGAVVSRIGGTALPSVSEQALDSRASRMAKLR